MKHNSVNDKFGVFDQLVINSQTYRYVSLAKCAEKGLASISRFPFAIRVLLEGVIRNYNGREITEDHIRAFTGYNPKKPADIEFPFMPARVLLQDFTGVPCVVDLAAMRSAVQRLGGDPKKINPRLPVDLIVDHSLNTDFFNSADAMKKNTDLEFIRNKERYEFLRWGQSALENFRVVPPASGICHQVNLEYLAKVVQSSEIQGGGLIGYFDTLVGTDSHTTMINGLGVLGWGVGGIEAEAAMLGQPIYMLIPPVVGVHLTGRIPAGITATDTVLRITEMLRAHGVVNKIVEFFGDGISSLNVPDRATLANMAPEYGATAGFFPVDQLSLDYLYQTGRTQEQIDLVEAYFKAQDMFWTKETTVPEYESILELDLSTIKAAIAGPKRPQDRINLGDVANVWKAGLSAPVDKNGGYALSDTEIGKTAKALNESNQEVSLKHGDIVIASITSCTNTSSPTLLMAAGLLAKKAVERGLKRQPWVKTSFAPGSKVVTEYLKEAGLMTSLEQLGFHLVGYGCASCIGNSGPLPEGIAKAIETNKLVVAAVLSGNRNFEGRVNPSTRANFLASPPLCVAYAIAGNIGINITTDPLGYDSKGAAVYLTDIWPSETELTEYVAKALKREAFQKSYSGIEEANKQWNDLKVAQGDVYQWQSDSSYIQEPPYFLKFNPKAAKGVIGGIKNARCLAWFGDSITTDHISPASTITPMSPAGKFLLENGIAREDFNSYGSRRGNDRVMTRGTFANIRLRNNLVPGTEGGITLHMPDGEQTSIYEAAMRYQNEGVPTIILAGKDYGMGSSRDWAAKGVQLLGVKAVIAESFERIHRSNLVGMGVLPLQIADDQTASSIGIDGSEIFSIELNDNLSTKQRLKVQAQKVDGITIQFDVIARIDSSVEISYYRNGGILQTVLANFSE